MRTAYEIADFVKRNRYGNFVQIEMLTTQYEPVSKILEQHEKVYTAFVGTVYGIPKHFMAISNKRFIINSLEKKSTKGIRSFPVDNILAVQLNDMKKGIIRFVFEQEILEVRVEPCYSKRITEQINDTLRRFKVKENEFLNQTKRTR